MFFIILFFSLLILCFVAVLLFFISLLWVKTFFFSAFSVALFASVLVSITSFTKRRQWQLLTTSRLSATFSRPAARPFFLLKFDRN